MSLEWYKIMTEKQPINCYLYNIKLNIWLYNIFIVLRDLIKEEEVHSCFLLVIIVALHMF